MNDIDKLHQMYTKLRTRCRKREIALATGISESTLGRIKLKTIQYPSRLVVRAMRRMYFSVFPDEPISS